MPREEEQATVEFFRSGELGPLRMGLSRDVVESLLGEAQESDRAGKKIDLVCYSERRLQLSFHDGSLCVIGLYFRHAEGSGFELPAQLACVFPFDRETDVATFLAYLKDHGIPHEVDIVASVDEDVLYRVGERTFARFSDGRLDSLQASPTREDERP